MPSDSSRQQATRQKNSRRAQFLADVLEVLATFDQMALTSGRADLSTLQRATAILPISKARLIRRLVEDQLAQRSERSRFFRDFPDVGCALRDLAHDLRVSMAEEEANSATPRPRPRTEPEATTPSRAEKIDQVILWVLAREGGPLQHKELAAAIESMWKWHCRPVTAKTIANHFANSEFLKRHTERDPGGRTLSSTGQAWVRDTPPPTAPRPE